MIEHRSTAELETEIKDVAHTAAVYARHNYGSEIRNGPEFEKTFVDSLEPILAEGINNFNGGKSDSRAQEIIAKMREK